MNHFEIALRIIAGVEGPYQHRALFLTNLEKRDPKTEGIIPYRERIGLEVKLACCAFLARRLSRYA